MWLKIEASAATVTLLLILLGLLNNSVNGLKYVWGDAFDNELVMGPDGNPYPWDKAARIATKQRNPRSFSDDSKLLTPKETRDILLKAFQAQERGDYQPGTSFMPVAPVPETDSHHQNLYNNNNNNKIVSLSASGSASNFGTNKDKGKNRNPNHNQSQRGSHRQGRFNNISNQSFVGPLPFANQSDDSEGDSNYGKHFNGPGPSRTSSNSNSNGNIGNSNSNNNVAAGEMDGCVPPRLCASTYNTTAPLYGVSLTSGQPVTIVQKFPDLLQQVVFQVCKTSECAVIHGECVQTYLPYLFLVIPLGPVTLTGQDYVLVESGCVCRPKYARRHDEPPPLPFIQALQN